jgi:hypothetical protein
LRELAIALLVAAVLLAGALTYARHTSKRNTDEAVASTLRKVKADAAALRGERWDRVRAASLLSGPGGLVDAFTDVGRPNHVTYAGDAMTVELRTGADADRACITVNLRRDAATFAATRCSPSRD